MTVKLKKNETFYIREGWFEKAINTIDEREFVKQVKRPSIPVTPQEINLEDYQELTTVKWIEHGYKGIFDMATGSGKTWTALHAATRLLEKKRTAIVICCPYQHLVDQWCEDLQYWGFDYIAGYSGSSTKNWKKKYSERIDNYNRGLYKYICIICTNATYSTPFMGFKKKRLPIQKCGKLMQLLRCFLKN